MKHITKLTCCQIVLLCMMLTSLGCATKTPSNDIISKQDKYAKYFQEQEKAVLIPVAQSAIGTPYKFGGTTIKGFDCSGFVKWAYSHAGVKLPRTAREQSKLGTAVKNKNDMKAGDIVAFYHPKRGYHTGIYVGEGKFVHSPRRRTKVRLSELSNPYFSKSFIGARRIVEVKPAEVSAAIELLRKHDQKAKTKPAKSTKQAKQAKAKKTASKKSTAS